MSQRSQLKKQIYKLQQAGQDFSSVQNKLDNIKLSPNQILQKIRTTIINSLDSDNIELEAQYRSLYMKVSGKAWVLPYRVKYLLNQRSSYLGDKIEFELSTSFPRKVRIKSISESQRFVVLEVDGKDVRINIETKHAFVSRNWFWFKHKNMTKSYKNCVRLKI